MTGPARATVTSVAGLGSETVVIALVAAVGLGSVAIAPPALVAAVGVALLVAAASVLRRSLARDV